MEGAAMAQALFRTASRWLLPCMVAALACLVLVESSLESPAAIAGLVQSAQRGSAIRLGFRKALAQRLFELENPGVGQFDADLGAVRRYGEAERRAFEQGYRAAMQDIMVIVGAALAALAFLLLSFSPALYQEIRAIVRPWAIRRVAEGHHWVVWIQTYRHATLDWVHQAASHTCGILFYITTLPLLFWGGELQLARHLTLFMALCIYVGNAVKDAVCSPRPDWSKGVILVGNNKGDETSKSHEEYGLPSTHTINTVCLLGYLLHYYNFYGPGEGLWLYQNILRSSHFLSLTFLVVMWSIFIIHGRLYLGMHSPVDVAAGLAVAIALLVFYIPIEDFVDAWMTSSTGFVPAYQLIFSVLLCWTYPTGLHPTPSYSYAVYFTGVCLGVITGVWRCPQYHGAEAAAAARGLRGQPFSWMFFRFVGLRFVVGFALVMVLRAISKEILKVVVPWVLRVLQIPFSDHEKFWEAAAGKKEKNNGGEQAGASNGNSHSQPIGYNVLTPIRLLNYAVVGWAVVEPAFDLFTVLGI